MTRDEAKVIKVGDVLIPDPCWNQTGSRKLADKTKVIGIRDGAGSQTRILFHVEFMSGQDAWLDAGWFLRKA